MFKVALVGTYPAGTFEKIRKNLPEDTFDLVPYDTEEKYATLEDADMIILRIFKATRETIERNKNLKMVLRWGAGFDTVDIEAAGERGVVVTNAPGANAGAVSELAVLGMLAIGRKLLCHEESLKNGVWSKSTFLNQSFTMNNKVVGIVGAGNIGRQVALKAQAFGATTQYFDVFKLSPEREEAFNLTYKPLDEILRTSDIITVHVPLTEENKHMIGAEQIAEMKDGAIIINTARGGLIDEKAVLEAVKSGKLAGAAIDAVENEPLSPDDELLHNPNIIITPHIGGGTADIGDAIIPMITDNLNAFAEGKEVQFVVNKQFLK